MKHQNKNRKSISVTNWLAIGITATVLGVTVFIGIHSLYDTKNADNNILLQTLIPLWSTWVGTVLAFYFGKNNFDAATKSYQEVIEKLSPHEKMAQLLVKDYMVTLNELVYLAYDEEKDNKIYDILKYKHFEPYNRFAVLDNQGVAKYIINRSLFNQFISSRIDENLNIEEIKSLTLEYFLENCCETTKHILENSFAVVSINATLLEAKLKMEAKFDCVNVFITKTGASNEKVEGLITNNIILKESNV